MVKRYQKQNLGTFAKVWCEPRSRGHLAQNFFSARAMRLERHLASASFCGDFTFRAWPSSSIACAYNRGDSFSEAGRESSSRLPQLQLICVHMPRRSTKSAPVTHGCASQVPCAPQLYVHARSVRALQRLLEHRAGRGDEMAIFSARCVLSSARASHARQALQALQRNAAPTGIVARMGASWR